MEFILRKASDIDFEEKIIIFELSDLFDIVDKSDVGSVIFSTRKVKEYKYDDGLKPVYEEMEIPEIIIYDDYIE